MFARIEVAMRPEYVDPAAQALLRRLELARPALRKKVRWARMVDVYWLDVDLNREEAIQASTEIFWDPVLQWMFTGNWIPSAGGKHGNVQDLMEFAPNRPGKFYGIERRFRGGVTDNVGRTTLEAFEIVAGRKFAAGRAASGSLLLLEGVELDEDGLATIAREVLCNELIETWNLLPELELKKSDRFHQERIKRDLPRVNLRGSDQVKTVKLDGLSDAELAQLSKSRLWALSVEEMKAARAYFASSKERERRRVYGLTDPTDVEMEVIAQTWSEHCKHKIFGARIDYTDSSGGEGAVVNAKVPAEIDSLFKTTISGTTKELPRPWLLSVFDDNAGIVAFDDEDAFCIKVETHNSPSALDPFGGALTGIVGVNRDILGCGLGARPIFNTNVFCLAPPDFAKTLPDRILHPRRILAGVRRGVENGGNQSGIPTINGALCFDERYLGKPLIYCGTGGFLPRTIAGRPCEEKRAVPGDRICMVGGRIGKDGIHGATFSSLAMDEASPATAVQLGDPITQKRMSDFLLEARDLGLYRTITDNGAGGLSSSVGEMAHLTGGARIDVSLAKTKYPGLLPYELVVSESQERMTVAVPPESRDAFFSLAERRGVEVSDLGAFTETGSFDVFFGDRPVASLSLEFLSKGVPRLELTAEWKGPPSPPLAGPPRAGVVGAPAAQDAATALLALLSRPGIASKEWLIRQYDHEVQGTSVIKPLHATGLLAGSALPVFSGPNDGGVIKPKPESAAGITVACGLAPRLSDIDPWLMAQAAVDESVRNALCVGADFGRPEAVFALVDNFCWPDPQSDAKQAAALVRACFGMREAALKLGLPLVSGKDSMKNDYRGKVGGQEVHIAVPPTLLMTAVAKVSDTKHARSADFKSAGDLIYRLMPEDGQSALGLWGSELGAYLTESGSPFPVDGRVGLPNWAGALKLYSWLGGTVGKAQSKLRSLHDISDGGLLVAVAECMMARGFGAVIELGGGAEDWNTAFGEGFHSFIASCSETDAPTLEAEWTALGIGFSRVGMIENASDKAQLLVKSSTVGLGASVAQLRAAWKREGYWE